MKHLCLFFLLIIMATSVYSQEPFRFRYRFRTLLNNPNIEFKMKDSNSTTTSYTLKRSNRTKLKGIITKTSEITGDRTQADTLFVRLWLITDSLNLGDPDTLNINNNYQDFIFRIRQWETHNGYYSLKIPFRALQIFGINIPLRSNLRNGEVGSDFINANVSLTHIWGRTRIYKTEFVKPRNTYGGVGGFIGLGTTKNKLDEDEVGFFYGCNIIFSKFNINIIGAIGLETGVSKNGRTAPNIGLGFGFDLFSFTGANLKNEE